MADKVEFELVSPEKLLLSEAVDMVVVPGGEGNFGVLPGHAPFISTVRMDVIEPLLVEVMRSCNPPISVDKVG